MLKVKPLKPNVEQECECLCDKSWEIFKTCLIVIEVFSHDKSASSDEQNHCIF